MPTISIGGRQYNTADYGSNLGAGELNAILAKSPGVTAQQAIDKFKNQGLSPSTAARSIASATPPPPPPPIADPASTPVYKPVNLPGLNTEVGLTPEQASQYSIDSGLISLKGNIDQEYLKLQGSIETNIANIRAASANYGYDQDRIARQYVADQERLSDEEVKEIEGRNNVALQKIINAGGLAIEQARGSSEQEVARITGQFGTEQEKIRQAGEKDIAKLSLSNSIYGGLINAFSF
jgi:hypothetical protein